IDSVKDIKKARRVGMTWMIGTVLGSLLLGFFGIAYLQRFDTQTMLQFDASRELSETIFIYLSKTLFHPLIGGFLLSAILAAVMSTKIGRASCRERVHLTAGAISSGNCGRLTDAAS